MSFRGTYLIMMVVLMVKGDIIISLMNKTIELLTKRVHFNLMKKYTVEETNCAREKMGRRKSPEILYTSKKCIR